MMEEQTPTPPSDPADQLASQSSPEGQVVITPKISKKKIALIAVAVFILVFLVLALGTWAYRYYQKSTATPSPTSVNDSASNTSNLLERLPTPTPAGSSTSGLAGATSVDTTKIPLGDDKVSSEPKVGYVYSCQTSFNGGGAFKDGEWIQGSFWDLTKKISVQGSVDWPSATFSAAIQGAQRLLSGNGLPVDVTTGKFPVDTTDPAYQYDRNPNSIKEHTVSYQIPANPTVFDEPTCVSLGAIGYAVNGVAIYNALDDAGRDAVAHEIQDSCEGHPQQQGEYHYHGPSSCVSGVEGNAKLVGYALDGFGIYSLKDKNGNEYTNADLDECHGTTGEIEWNGQTVNMYHYVLTREYPYTIGCFRGTPVTTTQGPPSTGNATAGTGAAPPSPGSGGEPPQAAITACSGQPSGAACSFNGGAGTVSGTCRIPPGSSTLACIP